MCIFLMAELIMDTEGNVSSAEGSGAPVIPPVLL